MTNQNDVQLPKYLQRAINSRVIEQPPFNSLTPSQWRDAAKHVYGDELRGFFQKGALGSYGRSARQTLFGILDLAVALHEGASQEVPHYKMAEATYRKLKRKSLIY